MDAPPYDPVKVGNRLRLLRKVFGITQEEMARIAGIDRSQLAGWERGKNRPGISKALLISDQFDLTLDWIYLGRRRGLTYDVATLIFSYETGEGEARAGNGIG